MRFLLAFPQQLVNHRYSIEFRFECLETINKLCSLYLRDNGKITRKKMSTLFSCDNDHYDTVKSRRDVNFEEMDTSTRKNDGF